QFFFEVLKQFLQGNDLLGRRLAAVTPAPPGFEEFDLRLMSSVNDVSDLPAEGNGLIIVADVQDVLHFRILDADGKKVVDSDETQRPDEASRIAELKSKLGALWGVPQLSRRDEDGVITAVTSILGHTLEVQPAVSMEVHQRLEREVTEGISRSPGTLRRLRLVLGEVAYGGQLHSPFEPGPGQEPPVHTAL